MRHAKRGGKLNRTSSHRKAMLRNLVTSLVMHERVETTDAKAREVRRVADRMVTLGKRGDLHARRQAMRVIRGKEATAKLFDALADRFRERPGGYTRVIKLGQRTGDAAPVSLVEWVEPYEAKAPDEEPKKKKSTRKKSTKKAASKAAEAEADDKPAKKKATKKATKKKTTKKSSAKSSEKSS